VTNIREGMPKEYYVATPKEGGRGLYSLMKETQTAQGEAASRADDGTFYRTRMVRPLAMMLVASSLLLGACGQQVQPQEDQPAQEAPAGTAVPQEEEGAPD
jgi:hypothetical protein